MKVTKKKFSTVHSTTNRTRCTGTLSVLLCILLVACAQEFTPPPPRAQLTTSTKNPQTENLYRPPTVIPHLTLAPPIPSDTPTQSSPTETPRPTATQICVDDLIFVEDLTIPDKTSVQPGSSIDKRWRVENSGSCNWDNNYSLRLIEGPGLSASPEQALYPARAGTLAGIQIVFTAPLEPGQYRSAWQAFNPQDEPFGQIFYLEIIVE